MLSEQTYNNYKIFLIGDHYEDDEEFKKCADFFPKDKIIYHNNTTSYRTGYFNYPHNKWAIGGIMAIKVGVEMAKKLGYKYYLHLDDDDVWTKDKLEIVKNNLQKFPLTEFMFHAAHYGYRQILPREHFTDIKVGYNNLMPTAGNIVHSTNVLSLSDKTYNLFMSHLDKNISIAENIKNGVMGEFQIGPFDAQLINLINGEGLLCFYIPEILTTKNTDGNIPE